MSSTFLPVENIEPDFLENIKQKTPIRHVDNMSAINTLFEYHLVNEILWNYIQGYNASLIVIKLEAKKYCLEIKHSFLNILFVSLV